MQASTSAAVFPCLRTAIGRRTASTTSSATATASVYPRRSNRISSLPPKRGRKQRVQVVANPNSCTFSEAVRILRSMRPGDTFSAYELTLHPRLAATVNINSLRGRSFLIHDAGNPKKKEVILVFAEGEKAEEARREGADVVGGKELVDELLANRISPTKIIATPEQLQTITRSTLPRILGPKGLMPSAKRGTVTEDIAQAIREARGGLDWKGLEIGPQGKNKPSAASSTSGGGSSKTVSTRGMVSVPIARMGFPEDWIRENVRHFSREVLDVCNGVGTQAEAATMSKGKQKRGEIEKMFLSTTQGVSLEVNDVQQLLA